MVLLDFIVILLLRVATGCPYESIFPCTCHRPSFGGYSYVTCAKLDNEQDLGRAVNALRRKSYIHSFLIENSIFNFLPSDVFNGLRFAELEIKDSSFRALTDKEVAFEGLEEHLKVFLMTNCTLMSEWDWTIFKNLKKLTKLDIVRSSLESVDDLDATYISNINDIALDHNRISFIHPFAFSSFKKLVHLSLDDNEIEVVMRSMLPNPALELGILYLSHNRIEQLPSDMFINMPNLKFLSLASNKILVLDEYTFAPIWENLDGFQGLGNDLRCDCRMSWILEKKFPKDVQATCAKPSNLERENITDLTSKHLWCYFNR